MMPHYLCPPLILTVFNVALIVSAEEQTTFTPPRLTAEQLSTQLKPSHPRLILTPQRLDAVREKVKTTPWAKGLHEELQSLADEFARPSSMERNPPSWKIWNSRMKRITTPALLFLLDGDQRYLEQAEREILVFCDEPENRQAAKEGRRQGLPQSSGVLGITLGYDWLYDDLSPETRKRVEETILETAFTRLYDDDANLSSFPDNNWRQVIHGAHAVAALAIGDKYPERCAQVLSDCLGEAVGVTAHLRPDGVSTESPHYWDFGMQFYAVMLDSLQTGLGHDFGLADWPVLQKTARWRVAASGPQGDFHYGDGSRYNGSMFFLSLWADRTGHDWLVQTKDIRHFTTDSFHRGGNEKAWMVLPLIWLPADAVDGTPPEDLLTFVGVGEVTGSTRSSWGYPPYTGPKVPGIVNVIHRGVSFQLADDRTKDRRNGKLEAHPTFAWNDPTALWIAAVGGRANVSHGHMHGGSFVLDLDGVRWFHEMETYHYDTLRERGISLWEWGVDLPGNKKDVGREQVYAWGSQGHNTLTVNGQFHDPNGTALLIDSADSDGEFSATLDLTAVLDPSVEKATRTFVVTDEAIEITDRWTAGEDAISMNARFHTVADVQVSDQEATLLRKGKTLRLKIVEPKDAKLTVRPMSAVVSRWDKPQDDVSVIDVSVPTDAGASKTLSIRLTK